MRSLFSLGLVFSAVVLSMNIGMAQETLYDISAKRIDGSDRSLSEYRGKVALVVNVASQCGYTPQYTGLQKLYDTYKERGFVVLGFPSNDFGGQEPGSEQEIQHFCSSKFGVTFPLFAKVSVLGASKHPVYSFLTTTTGGEEVGWNFEKFLVGNDGRVVGRFPSRVTPQDQGLIKAIEGALATQ